MNGKNKCKILKEIRRRIAEANDIEYVTRECEFRGECKGTCPRCESELRYLEKQLEKRRMCGKQIVVATLATGLLFTSAGCDLFDKKSAIQDAVLYEDSETVPEDIDELEGDVVYEPELIGEVPYTPEENEEEPELMGDVPYIPEEEPELMGAPEENDILEEDAACEVPAE